MITKQIAKILFTAALLLTVVMLQAAFAAGLVYWWSASSGNWNCTSGCWSNNSTPTPTDDILIGDYLGTGFTYTVTLDTNPTVSSLTVGASTGAQKLALGVRSLTTTSSGAVFLPNATLNTTISGTQSTQYGQLSTLGTTTYSLNGTLEVILSGYTPTAGDTFSIIHGANVGSFATTSLPALSDPGLTWNISYNPGDVTLRIVPLMYTITSSAGPGGSISPSGSTLVTGGASQTYTIAPGSGYQVLDVLVDGVSKGAVSSYTFPNVSANHTISVSFTTATYTITSSGGSGGTISPSGTVTVSAGQSAFFTFTANSGYRIDAVWIDGLPLADKTFSSLTYVTSYVVEIANVQSNHTIAVSFVIATAPRILNVSPFSNATTNTAKVGYTLSAPAASGSITFMRIGGALDTTSPHVYTLTAADCTTGSHIVSTGLPLVNGAIYNMIIEVMDSASNASHKIVNNVTYEVAYLAIDSPLANTYVNSATVSYRLLQNISAGDITVAWSGGTADPLAPYRYSLSGAQLSAGNHLVDTGFPLVNQAVYTFAAENVLDSSGYPTLPPAAIENVTFDDQAVGIRSVLPAAKSITSSATVNYTLSDNAASGTVSFTWSGGAGDAAAHVYNMTSTDLISGGHTLDTGFTLVQNAFYTVTFQVADRAGNSTTLSNGMVFYDSQYGIGPDGDLDHDGHVTAADLQTMQNALDSQPGDARWNPVADLDGNNKIDQQDLLILMSHYGQ